MLNSVTGFVVFRVNSALMNLFSTRLDMTSYFRPYMVTKRAVPMNSTDLIDVHNMFQLNYCMSVTAQTESRLIQVKQNKETQDE